MATERTVAIALEEWRVAHREWARTTKRDYESRAALVCNDKTFAGIRLDRLRRKDVDAWVGRMVKRDVPGRSIVNQVAVVRSAVGFAVAAEHLGNHPFPNYRLSLPKREKPEKLEDDVVKAALAAAAKHGPVRHLQVRLACVAALRRSEAAALEWTSLKGDELSITGQVFVETTNETGTKGGKPRRHSIRKIDRFLKTDASYRTVTLDDETVRLWAAARDSQGQPSRFVFGEGDEIPSPDRPYRVWLQALSDADQPPIRLHATRHWSASNALAAGRSVADVANRLGNTPETVTRTYAHATKSSKRATAETLGSLLDSLDVELHQPAE